MGRRRVIRERALREVLLKPFTVYHLVEQANCFVRRNDVWQLMEQTGLLGTDGHTLNMDLSLENYQGAGRFAAYLRRTDRHEKWLYYYTVVPAGGSLGAVVEVLAQELMVLDSKTRLGTPDG